MEPSTSSPVRRDGTSRPQGLTARLVRHCQQLAAGPLADDVARVARHSLLDWLAVAHAGWHAEVVSLLRAQVQEDGGHAKATLIDGTRVSTPQAALVNGTASHVLDYDDAHLQSRVHPSVPLWSAILAHAEARGLGGAAALAAYAVGVELQSRVALLMGEAHYARGWHNTATLGALGATMAIAALDQLSTERTCHALSLAATQAAGMRALFGTMGKPLHAGHAAATGLQAARLAGRGFVGVDDILERPDGFARLYADEVFIDKPLQSPGAARLLSTVYKYHASCYGTQAPIEACLALRAEAGLDLQALKGIAVRVEQQYLDVCCIPEPTTVSEAKFSIAHMVALALSGRSTVDAASFGSEALRDPMLAALRKLVVVGGGPDMPRAQAEVRLVFRDGTCAVHRADASRAESDLGRQEKRLREKARTLIGGVRDEAESAELIDRALRFQHEGHVADFMACLQRAPLKHG
jgi:2-methylcitrate dehydratase PrpD